MSNLSEFFKEAGEDLETAVTVTIKGTTFHYHVPGFSDKAECRRLAHLKVDEEIKKGALLGVDEKKAPNYDRYKEWIDGPLADTIKEAFLDEKPKLLTEQIRNEMLADAYGDYKQLAHFTHAGECLIFNEYAVKNVRSFVKAWESAMIEKAKQEQVEAAKSEPANPMLGAGESLPSASTSVSVQMSALDQSNGKG